MFVNTLQRKKQDGKKLTMLTAYDAPTAAMLVTAGIDVILVGDSVGNVMAGYSDTLPVRMEDMLYHTSAVLRGAPGALVIADMPFLSYQTSISDAIYNAGQFLKLGAKGVKLETSAIHLDVVRTLVAQGIPVLGHVGLTPQSVNQLGGYKVQGKSETQAQDILDLCIHLEDAGCFGIVLELVGTQLAKRITSKLTIPTFGIGAGLYCDGQVLVTADLLGMSPQPPKKFVKPYAQIYPQMLEAIGRFKTEVETSQFPDSDHSFL